MLRSEIAGSCDDSVFSFLRNLHTVLHSGCINLHSTNSIGVLFFTPSPAFVFRRVFNDGHSDQCEVVPHCSFDFHFSNNSASSLLTPSF